MPARTHPVTQALRNFAKLAAALALLAPAAGNIYIQSPEALLPGLPHHSGLPGKEALEQAAAVLVTDGKSWDEDIRGRMEAYVAAGGGVVLVHDAIPASGWVEGELRRWEGPVPLFFTPAGRGHVIGRGVSNFDVDDEMFHGLRLPAGVGVLATTWTPNRKHLKGADPQPYVYGVSPMIWTATRGKGRVVFFVPGKNPETLRHPAIRALLARSLAWAGRFDDPDSLSPDIAADTLTYPPGGPMTPRASLESLQVHLDFTAELVAAEPLISKPLNIDWDEKGRLWVVESLEYPEGRKGGGPESMYSTWQREDDLPKPPAVKRPGLDRISWLEDADGDGVMDRKHVFADDLDLATSFCFHRDGVIVAQPPEILWLRDTDGDGRADRRETLYRGLGTHDTHAVLNNLRWGLDGWIYATHGYSGSPRVTSGDGRTDFGAIGSGIVRFRPDGTAIEMVSAKNGNCWGFEMTADGELFFTQPTSGDLLMHVPLSDRIMAEAGMGREPSWNVLIHMQPVKPLMSWEEIVESQPNDVIGSFTAACGTAIYEGGSWPGEWALGYFTAEPTVHIVHHEKLSPAGVTFTAEKMREQEFSATRDFWSRPIDTRAGPDGQLYSIDFYNQAILHNDPRGPIHLWNNQAARPDRDHYFGRIHRYRHRGAKPLPAADLTTLAGRVAALSHPNREVRFRAQRLIEEGDVKAAAAMLEKTGEGFAKVHALWVRAAAGALAPAELIAALEHGDASVRVTAARVLAAHPKLATPELVRAVSAHLSREGDSRVRLQLLAALPVDTRFPAEILVSLQAGAAERWTQAAVARLAKNAPGETLAAALASPEPVKQTSLIGLLLESSAGDSDKLVPMLQELDKAGHPEIAAASLLLLHERELPGGAALEAALEKLSVNADARIAAAALPLAARCWSGGDLEKSLAARVPDILRRSGGDAAVLSPLAKLPVFPGELAERLKDAAIRSDEARASILQSLRANSSGDAVRLAIDLLPALQPVDKSALLEALLARPESSIALADALAGEKVSPAIVGPQVLNRLAEHPNASVREHAAPVVARFRGEAEAKSELIDRLLPEVSAPGDPVKGRELYAACAVCHVFRGEGVSIGPVLEGMGVHGVETLLTHIVDPNREVEPSYRTWHLTTKDGRTETGFISRETAGSVFVRNVAGEIEVPRDGIVSRVDTRKSLMPEGLEALGAEALRDLIAYLRSGEQRFHTLPLGRAATADGSRGVYLARDVAGDRVGLKRYGLVEEQGVPFQLQDPATAPGGRNVIVLRGGMEARAVSRTMPESVGIPANVAAGRLHLLGAVAGWGFPAFNGLEPVMTVTVRYRDGTAEELVFVNGIDIADHLVPVDVPGSARTGLTDHGQIRYLWRDLKKPDVPVEKIVLSSAGIAPAPMVAAITLESPGKDGTMAPPPEHGGPAPAGENR